jgi:hypothetical protein
MDMSYTQDVYMSHGTEYVFSINGREQFSVKFPFYFTLFVIFCPLSFPIKDALYIVGVWGSMIN